MPLNLCSGDLSNSFNNTKFPTKVFFYYHLKTLYNIFKIFVHSTNQMFKKTGKEQISHIINLKSISSVKTETLKNCAGNRLST